MIRSKKLAWAVLVILFLGSLIWANRESEALAKAQMKKAELEHQLNACF